MALLGAAAVPAASDATWAKRHFTPYLHPAPLEKRRQIGLVLAASALDLPLLDLPLPGDDLLDS